MTNQVSWHVELAVKFGGLDNFRTLTKEMVEHAHGESGVLGYERFVSEDGKIVHVYETYVDSAAALAHLRIFATKFAARFTGMVEREQFTVYGHPSAQLRKMLDGFGARYLRPFDGFSR